MSPLLLLTTLEFFKITITFAPLLLLAIGIYGLVHYRQLPSGLRYLVALCWMGVTIDLIARMLWEQKRSNLFLIPIDLYGEFLLLSLVYRWALHSEAYARALPWVLGIFGAVVGAVSLLTPLNDLNSTLQVTECLLLLVLAGLYFRQLLSELRVQRLSQDSMFWVSAGLLLYALGKMFIALFGNYAMHHFSKQMNIAVWTIHSLLSVVMYTCYGVGLWKRPQK